MKRKIQRLEMTEGNYGACVSDPPTKTQTRRRMRDQPPPETHRMDPEPFGLFGAYERSGIRIPGTYKPRLRVGDIAGLTLPHWRVKLWRNGLDPIDNPGGIIQIFDAVTGVLRATDGACVEGFDVQKEIATGAYTRKAARYMPVWACLHFAEIVAVRAERLGEITYEDCLAEGIRAFAHLIGPALAPVGGIRKYSYPGQPLVERRVPTPLGAYAAEWEALHCAGAWDPDQWVWVLDFKLCDPPSREAMADSGPEPTSPSIASATEGYEGQGDEP